MKNAKAPTLTFLCSILLFAVACGDDRGLGTPLPDAGTDVVSGDVAMGDVPTVETGLRGTGELTFPSVYSAPTNTVAGEQRPWVPVDLDEGTDGALWVIHRMNRKAEFVDETECTGRVLGGGGGANDCGALEGGTATITDPAAAEPATEANGRVRFVVDRNSFHFMRRPSAIAFGTADVSVEPGDPGTELRDGTPIVTETQTYTHIFATCSDHLTGNATDGPVFNGPSLWTGDPNIYRPGFEGGFEGMNGSHLDMVHGTSYCTGLAWERDQVYWAVNGAVGSLDRYDFGKPHIAGHFYHEDATIQRFLWPEVQFVRVEDVPSNIEVDSDMAYVADTGSGRIVAIPTVGTPAPTRTFTTPDPITGDVIENPAIADLVSNAALVAAWGAGAQPSGLAVLDASTLVIADHNSGNISVVDRESGEIVRTADTGLGLGLGGLTVMGGSVYFTHMETRQVYRIDVAE